MDIKIEKGAKVQITDKQIVNNIIYGDVVQRKEVSLPEQSRTSNNVSTVSVQDILDRVESNKPVCWSEVTDDYRDFNIIKKIILSCSSIDNAKNVYNKILEQYESDLDSILRQKEGDNYDPEWMTDPEKADPIWNLSDELKLILKSRPDYDGTLSIHVDNSQELIPECDTQIEEEIGYASSLSAGLSDARQSRLDEIIMILHKGNWKLPATSEKIVQLLNTVFGKEQTSIEEDDIPMCNKMWALIEGGRGDRMKIVPANLAGFFADENLLTGTSSEISSDLFGNVKMVNNVTDGKKGNRSYAFEKVIPFLTKYTNKIIRQV